MPPQAASHASPTPRTVAQACVHFHCLPASASTALRAPVLPWHLVNNFKRGACGVLRQVEGITIDAEGLGFLGELSETTSLRHAVQLLTPAMTLTRTNGRDSVTRTDLEEVAELFHDAKYSARLLAEQADKYIQ